MKIPIFDAVELGEPWRLNKDSQGVAVPILLKDSPRKRDYKLIDEVKDKVVLKDTGNIDGLNVENKSSESVFIRKGTMLTGGTQHRAVQVSIIASPKSVTVAPIRCIYASKGIRSGATFTTVASSYVPRNVEKSLRRGQSETWNAVGVYSASLSSSDITSNNISSNYITSGSYGTIAYDNLTDNVEKSTKIIDNALKDVPGDHVRQIGLVVVGAKGVEGIEMFDHPDSWSAMSKGVVRNYADILTNVIPDIFEININKVKEYVFAFLTKIQNVEGTEAFCNSDAKTYEFQTNEIEGEFTIFNEGLIHVLANAVEKRESEKKNKTSSQPMVIGTITTSDWASTATRDSTWMPQDNSNTFTISLGNNDCDDKDFKNKSDTVNLLTKKRGYETLSSIADNPKTFTEIQTFTGMSSKTVDQGLKEAETLGLIERMVRGDGAVAYKLTNSGTRTNPKKFKKSFQ